jgi:hypothetical protein
VEACARNHQLASPGKHEEITQSARLCPCFNRELALMQEYMVLVSGSALYTVSTMKFSRNESVFMEAHVPRHGSVSFGQPILLALFSDKGRNELIEALILTDGVHKATIERVDDLTLATGDHCFTFRTPEECKLWHVITSDLKIASSKRLLELLDLNHDLAPRGYRTHFASLMRSLESATDRINTTHSSAKQNSSSILVHALSCIDYLSSRIEHCQCSNNISLEMEDTVYETRSRLCELISRNSYSSDI